MVLIQDFDVMKINYAMSKLLLTLKTTFNKIINNISFIEGSYIVGYLRIPTISISTLENSYEDIKSILKVMNILGYINNDDYTISNETLTNAVNLYLYKSLEESIPSNNNDMSPQEIEYLFKYQLAYNIENLNYRITNKLSLSPVTINID